MPEKKPPAHQVILDFLDKGSKSVPYDATHASRQALLLKVLCAMEIPQAVMEEVFSTLKGVGLVYSKSQNPAAAPIANAFTQTLGELEIGG